ncbi:Complement C1q tumor necrosis factor protein, partial [Fasciolopsis buskii]
STDITITPFFLDQLTSQLQRRQTYVAFFAGLELNIVEKPIDPNPRVLMSRVITNVGRAYHASTGEFVAPVHGVYVLTAAISAQGRARAAVRLMHNDQQVFDIWAESSPWSTATNQGILQMRKGDRAWLSIREGAYFLHGYMYSTFSGYLLFQYDGDS